MNDKIGAAIAEVESRRLDMIEVPVQIASTGRPVVMAVPSDLTDGEIVELGAFVLIGLRKWIAQRARPSGLIVPTRSS